MGNWIQTSQTLRRAVQEINQLEIKAKLRFELCEVIRHHVQLSYNALNKLYFRNATFLSHETQKIADSYFALLKELALAYKILSQQREEKSLIPWDKTGKNIQITAIQRCISTLSDTVLLCLKLSVTVPQGLWAEVNHLYHEAISTKDSKAKVEDPRWEQNQKTSIAITYHKLLIIASACPYQLTGEQLDTLNTLAVYLSDSLELAGLFSSQYFYYVPLTRDLGPTFFQNAGQVAKEKGCLFLDLSIILDEIKTMRQSAPLLKQFKDQDLIDAPIDPYIFNHLILCWNLHYKNRRNDRKPCHLELEIACGLNLIQRLLLGKTSYEELKSGVSASGKEQKSKLSRIQPIHPTHKTPIDTSKKASPFQTQSSEKSLDFGTGSALNYNVHSNSAAKNSEDIPLKFHSIRAVNKNEKGLGIVFLDASVQVKPGELIYFRVPQQDRFYLGLLKWVYIKNEELQGGIETISNHTKPIAIEAGRVQLNQSSFDRALLTSPAKENALAIIHAPTPKYKRGMTCTISEYGNIRTVKLFKEIFVGFRFSSFEIKDMIEEGQPQKSWSIH